MFFFLRIDIEIVIFNKNRGLGIMWKQFFLYFKVLQRKKLEIIQHCKKHLSMYSAQWLLTPVCFCLNPQWANYELWVNRYCNTFKHTYFITYIFVVFLMVGMCISQINMFGKLYIFLNVEPVDVFPSLWLHVPFFSLRLRWLNIYIIFFSNVVIFILKL